jgi:hypothetical protein
LALPISGEENQCRGDLFKPRHQRIFISVTCQVLYNKPVINIIYNEFYTKHSNAIATFVVSVVVAS